MIQKQILTLILCSFYFSGCGSSNTKTHLSPEEDKIQLEVELERNTTSTHPLDITFKLTNMSDKTVYYNKLDVPFGDTTSLHLFNVLEDNIPVKYIGIMPDIVRNTFDSLAPGEIFRTSVAIDKMYQVTKGTHNYRISYFDSIVAKTSDGKNERVNDDGVPLKPNELGSKERTSRAIKIPSNTLEFEATISQIREQ